MLVTLVLKRMRGLRDESGKSGRGRQMLLTGLDSRMTVGLQVVPDLSKVD